MAFCSSSDFSDFDYDFSTDSGLSSSQSSSPNLFQGPIFLTEEVAVYNTAALPVQAFTVELVPVYITWPTKELTQVQPPHSNRRLIKWSLPPPIRPATPIPGWKPMPYELEIYWQSAFSWFFRPFFSSYGHLWTMKPTDVPPVADVWPWFSSTFTAKVRFQCQCRRCWSSMKGQVAFWYRIYPQDDRFVFQVLFKLLGQQCVYCNSNTAVKKREFLTPLWYPEEIENAIFHLLNQISVTYYGMYSNFTLPNVRRGGCSKSKSDESPFHHVASSCQACDLGICSTAAINLHL